MKHDIVILDAATIYPADDSRWQAFGLAKGLSVKVYDRTSPGDIVARCSGAAMALTNKVPFDAATIAALPELRYIGVLATGYNIVDTEAAARAGVVGTNIPAYSTASVAQHAIAMLLSLANRTPLYASPAAQRAWSRCADFSMRLEPWHELAGKTFGVVGLGNTGRATAAIAAALGMKILAYTSKDAAALPEGYAKAATVDELFAAADVVSLHCPLTPATRHLVDARRLSLMKPGAILVNTSRGPVVDEAALAAALAAGSLAGAGLDVLVDEPPRPDNPLLSAPNCIITPHIAWASVEACERLYHIALANVKAFVEGKPINTVNR